MGEHYQRMAPWPTSASGGVAPVSPNGVLGRKLPLTHDVFELLNQRTQRWAQTIILLAGGKGLLHVGHVAVVVQRDDHVHSAGVGQYQALPRNNKAIQKASEADGHRVRVEALPHHVDRRR